MKTETHLLSKVWDDYPEIFGKENALLEVPSIENFIAEIFAVGEFYYYVINLYDGTVSNFHENVLKLHGLKQYPSHLKEIINLIHPEDIPFVMEAERMSIEKIKEIGFEHQMNLKSSYCFRMKTPNGEYQMFHHQALHTRKSQDGRLMQTVNIHTNIHHLNPVNNYIVLVSGVGERNDFYQMHYTKTLSLDTCCPENLSKRELEILHLIAKGLSSRKISDFLMLSDHTVRTHRKNILKKTQTKNSSELIKKCIEWGYI